MHHFMLNDEQMILFFADEFFIPVKTFLKKDLQLIFTIIIYLVRMLSMFD